jgi:hypothetical protein
MNIDDRDDLKIQNYDSKRNWGLKMVPSSGWDFRPEDG